MVNWDLIPVNFRQDNELGQYQSTGGVKDFVVVAGNLFEDAKHGGTASGHAGEKCTCFIEFCLDYFQHRICGEDDGLKIVLQPAFPLGQG